jgi:hypothetical protein
MKDKSYSITIDINNSSENVFNHINNVPQWWIRVAGGQQTEFEGHSTNLNDEFVLRHGKVHYSKHKLTEIVPYKKIVWLVTESRLTWIKGNKKEWTGTKMIFELTSQDAKTLLHFVHQGLVPELECYEHSVQFWMVIKIGCSNISLEVFQNNK